MVLLCSSLGFVLKPALSGFLSRHRDPAVVQSADAALATRWPASAERRDAGLAVPRPPPAAASSPVIPDKRLQELRRRPTPGPARCSDAVPWVFLLRELAWGAYSTSSRCSCSIAMEPAARTMSTSSVGIGGGFCVSFAVTMPLLTKYCSTRAYHQRPLIGTVHPDRRQRASRRRCWCNGC